MVRPAAAGRGLTAGPWEADATESDVTNMPTEITPSPREYRVRAAAGGEAHRTVRPQGWTNVHLRLP